MSTHNGVKRRDFLKTSGAATTVAVAGGAAVAPLAATANGIEFSTLSEHQGYTLIGMARQLFPHDFLADQYYAAVIQELDTAAAEDPALAQLLTDGVAALDAATSVAWIDLSDGYQLVVLKSLQDTPFFNTVKGKTLVSLYNNPLVWRHFGYEGEAFTKGGYINRGFNDLSWLPEPPDDASPPVA